MKVKSPMPGACAPAFTVGFPKPRSASHVAASMRSLLEAFLLRNGVPINAVQVRAGHSSPMVTLSVYGHVIPGEDELAASVFARVMAGSEKS